MRKILCVMLALTMLLGLAVLFASCGDKKGADGVSLSKNTVAVNISDYTIVYGPSMNANAYTTTFKQRVTVLGDAISAITGKNVRIQTSDRAKDSSGKEILIGLTDRAESQSAQGEIEGMGFAIKATDNKIAITGSNNLMVLHAMQYFAEHYLNTSSTTVSVHESVVCSNMEQIVVADSANGSSYTHVYPADTRTDKQSPDYASVTGDYRDYEAVAASMIAERMKELTKLAAKKYAAKGDNETAEKEVLIGMVDRAENAALRATIDSNQWVIAAEGNKIQVTSWNITTLMAASSVYVDVLTEASVVEDGVTKIVFPKGLRLCGSGNPNWIMDFPKPQGEGIALYNTMDASDDSFQFLYTGSGVNASSYKAYCDTLKAQGYTVLTESTAEESIFTTFVNKEEGISLYVAYNAFTHKDDYGAYDDYASKVKTGDEGYYDFDACFRIVSSPMTHEYANLPDSGLLTKNPSYTKITDSAVTTMPLYDSAVGLIYVVTLEDGSFVVFDSGTTNQQGDEHTRLWNLLVSLHTKVHNGKAPSTSEPVRIAAWIVTHAHGDHYSAFERMLEWLKNTSKSKYLKIDYMLGNYPNEGASYPIWTGLGDFGGDTIPGLSKDSGYGFKFVKVHTGQKYYLANLEIEVITTWEDLNPRTTYTSNDSNTVVRFTLTSGSSKVTQMWTGDANRWQSRWMCAMYGDYLQSDMVSVAHHGNLGCEIEFYDMVSPTAVWWPHNSTAVWNYLNPSKINSNWQYQVDQHLIYDIPSVRYLFTSGGDNSVKPMDGVFTTLWLRGNGPDYDNLQDAMSWLPISYNKENAVKLPLD